jgi:hypothetical protein
MQTNTQETRSIEDIVKMIDTGKLVLPEFQRDFKWPIEKTETLFDSIFQDLFIGSLIVSKPKFDLACKGFDFRERGSKKHKPKPQLMTSEDFEQKDIYTLLDGQQRTTAIYRALKGLDVIYIIFKDIDTLLSTEFYDYDTNQIKVKYDEYIEGFDSVQPKNDVFYLRICDLYSSMDYRESKFQIEFVDHIIAEFQLDEVEKDVLTDFALTLHKDFRSDMIKKANLLSVQLLNMGLEKFCLYFERSNSQGLNLSFTDIITAKIYIDFKLTRKITDAIKDFKYFNESLVDTIVRYINFISNGEVTKKSILKDLKGIHFIDHWDSTIKDLNYIQGWLEENNWLFKVADIPYRTMLLPILAFYQNLPNKEFSQANQIQLDQLKFWFYGSILDNRYGGARHGSTNVVIKKDCEIMMALAKGTNPESEYWSNLRIEYSFDEFKKLDNNSNAKFMAISYFMWSKNRFKNLENNAIVSVNHNIEIHHIFPSNYLKTKFGENSAEYDLADSILNKIRINKISNIKISNKAPSEYLKEIRNQSPNPKIEHSLDSHHIGDTSKLISGQYDSDFLGFLKSRYDQIEPLFHELKRASLNLANGRHTDIWI